MNATHPALIRALMNPALYAHPVAGFKLVETHISWVLLTGSYAYKIKKPVDLGFLDFSTLELRRYFCEEELRLNQRLAPQVYVDVVAITGSMDAPAINGAGDALEYAVRMREFDPAQQLDRLILRDRIDGACLATLAEDIAGFHEAAARVEPYADWGRPAQILHPVIENFDQIDALSPAGDFGAELDRLRAWSLAAHERLEPRFALRRQHGFIRECHGDLHLGNIAMIDGRAVPFDCLEFSPALRWIDVISEIAFLVMDLDYHGRTDLSVLFLNHYLHYRGDYPGMVCLDYYLVYRAMVRAKVACIRASQSGDDMERAALLDQLRRHVALAAGYTRERRPALIITHGLSGSGKTTVTDTLLAHARALRIRSDVERKRLHGLAPDARSGSAPGGGIYDRVSGQQTYERLAECGAAVITAGYPAIIDATFLKRAQRDRFRALASELGVPLLILDFAAPEDALRERIQQRAAQARDASEAGLEVLGLQLREQEPLGRDELADVLTIDTTAPVDARALAARIRAE
jgi:uncharacterized protein